MKTNRYHGWRSRRGCKVQVNGKGLPRRLDLRNHSPDGFEWGYAGSGPAQLSLAILAHEFGDAVAGRHYQDFKREVICGLGSEWVIESFYLDAWLAANAEGKPVAFAPITVIDERSEEGDLPGEAPRRLP